MVFFGGLTGDFVFWGLVKKLQVGFYATTSGPGFRGDKEVQGTRYRGGNLISGIDGSGLSFARSVWYILSKHLL